MVFLDLQKKKRPTAGTTETRGEQSEGMQGPETYAARHVKKLHMKTRCPRLFQIMGNYPYPDLPQILLSASVSKVGIGVPGWLSR